MDANKHPEHGRGHHRRPVGDQAGTACGHATGARGTAKGDPTPATTPAAGPCPCTTSSAPASSPASSPNARPGRRPGRPRGVRPRPYRGSVDLAGVWVCTDNGGLVRADKIGTLRAVGSSNAYPLRASETVSICTDLPGGVDGDFQTRWTFAQCEAGDAAHVITGLLQAISGTAAEAAAPPVIIYRQRDGAWAAARELPAELIAKEETPKWRRWHPP